MNYLQTAIHLKKVVEIALGELLGSYSLPSGQKIEAIAINPSMANLVFPPSNTLIEELECHIYYPEITGKSIVGGAFWNLSWLIYFKQWDIKKNDYFRC